MMTSPEKDGIHESMLKNAGHTPYFFLLIGLYLMAGCSEDLVQTEDELVLCEDGCDLPSGINLEVCTPRDVAIGVSGCIESSAVNIGIDSVRAVSSVNYYVVLNGLSDIYGANVALNIYDGEEVINSIGLHNLSDGSHRVSWDGTDSNGYLATAAFHTIRLEAWNSTDRIASNEHVTATLTSLPDTGAGYTHPLGTDRVNTDDWGRAHVIEALQNMGEEWDRSHNIPIQYLDLSSQNGGEFPPHWTHRNGECLDVRYVRTDGEGPIDLRYGTRYFDRSATQELFDLFFEYGAIEIFTDQVANINGENVVFVGGHTNHFHVVFGLTPEARSEDRAVNQGAIGGPCLDDSDCHVRRGYCLRDVGTPVGICTRTCDAACSDYVGGNYTRRECVSTDSGRLCMPARDYTRYPESDGCRADLTQQSLRSMDQSNAYIEVCIP